VAREGFARRVPQLERQAQQGFLRNSLAEYERRLTSEIEMIKKMRYEGYFLIVWDLFTTRAHRTFLSGRGAVRRRGAS